MKLTQVTICDKNTIYILRNETPLGWVHCFSATEWSAYKADGKFVDWFTSKAAAIKAIA